MKKQANLWNLPALIFAGLMLISGFLPWSQVSSSASFMGFSSSLRQSTTGFQTGIGIISAALSMVCVVLVLLRSRFSIIPGIICLLLALVPLIGIDSIYASSDFGEAYSGIGFGVYVLLFSCIGYIIAAFFIYRTSQFQGRMVVPSNAFNSQGNIVLSHQEETSKSTVVNAEKGKATSAPEESQKKESGSPIEKTSSRNESVDREPVYINSKVVKRSGSHKKYVFAVVVLLILASVFTWMQYSTNKSHQEKAKLDLIERERIQNIVSSVNEAVSKHDYDLALVILNSIQWTLDNDKENILKYELQRENMKIAIMRLKKEKDSLELVQNAIDLEIAMRKDSIWQAEDVESKKEMYPYVAIITAGRTFLYKEPDINSGIGSILVYNSKISVMAKQEEFLFCRTTLSDGNVVSGWILYKDVEKY